MADIVEVTRLRPWQIKDFPERKRQSVIEAASNARMTVAQWLEPIIDRALADGGNGSVNLPVALAVNRVPVLPPSEPVDLPDKAAKWRGWAQVYREANYAGLPDDMLGALRNEARDDLGVVRRKAPRRRT